MVQPIGDFESLFDRPVERHRPPVGPRCDFARYVVQLCQRNWREGGQGALTTRLSRAASTTSVVTVARPLMVSTRSIWANSRWMGRKFPPVTRAMVLRTAASMA